MDQHSTAMLLIGAIGSMSGLVALGLIVLRLRADGRSLRDLRF